MSNTQTKIRVAKYKRVSTDEQKLKKNSIIAQDEILNEYIKNNPNMILVGDFSDEAISRTKTKRNELQKLLKMVEAREVDLILVTKLDRWFGNVARYYKIQDILDRNHVNWKTILEDYDTSTADGRLKVNIMLAVAQNEVERTSERIKVVFNYKIKHGHAITGALSYGFKTEPKDNYKIVVHNKNHEALIYDFLDYFETVQSLHGSMNYINKKYGLNLSKTVFRNILTDTMMYGSYKGNDNYCPPYISKERFERLYAILGNNIRCNTKEGRVYIFSGLIRCHVCGNKMAGHSTSIKRKSGVKHSYKHYICSAYKNNKSCTNGGCRSENIIEKKVLKELLPQLENLIIKSEIQEDKPKPKVNKKAIHKEMERLNIMYQKGRISDERYDYEYENLIEKLNSEEVERPKKDYSKLYKILETDFKSLYKTFTDSEKQIFFRSIIESITLDGDNINIKFL